jgi:hypothetical protein
MLITDDQEVVREELLAVPSQDDDLHAVSAVSTVDLGLRAAIELRPDIVLVSLHLPDLSTSEYVPEPAGLPKLTATTQRAESSTAVNAQPDRSQVARRLNHIAAPRMDCPIPASRQISVAPLTADCSTGTEAAGPRSTNRVDRPVQYFEADVLPRCALQYRHHRNFCAIRVVPQEI